MSDRKMNTKIRSLKSLPTLFDTYLNHIPVKFGQIRGQNCTEFGASWQKTGFFILFWHHFRRCFCTWNNSTVNLKTTIFQRSKNGCPTRATRLKVALTLTWPRRGSMGPNIRFSHISLYCIKIFDRYFFVIVTLIDTLLLTQKKNQIDPVVF